MMRFSILNSFVTTFLLSCFFLFLAGIQVSFSSSQQDLKDHVYSYVTISGDGSTWAGYTLDFDIYKGETSSGKEEKVASKDQFISSLALSYQGDFIAYSTFCLVTLLQYKKTTKRYEQVASFPTGFQTTFTFTSTHRLIIYHANTKSMHWQGTSYALADKEQKLISFITCQHIALISPQGHSLLVHAPCRPKITYIHDKTYKKPYRWIILKDLESQQYESCFYSAQERYFVLNTFSSDSKPLQVYFASRFPQYNLLKRIPFYTKIRTLGLGPEEGIFLLAIEQNHCYVLVLWDIKENKERSDYYLITPPLDHTGFVIASSGQHTYFILHWFFLKITGYQWKKVLSLPKEINLIHKAIQKKEDGWSKDLTSFLRSFLPCCWQLRYVWEA